jgi:hypothetical protein
MPAQTRSTRPAPRQSVVPRLLRAALRALRAGALRDEGHALFFRDFAPPRRHTRHARYVRVRRELPRAIDPPSAGCARSAPPLLSLGDEPVCGARDRRFPRPYTDKLEQRFVDKQNPFERVATRRTRSVRGRRRGRLTSGQATESGGQLRIVPLQRRILGPQDESPVPAAVPIRYGGTLAPHSPSSGRRWRRSRRCAAPPHSCSAAASASTRRPDCGLPGPDGEPAPPLPTSARAVRALSIMGVAGTIRTPAEPLPAMSMTLDSGGFAD